MALADYFRRHGNKIIISRGARSRRSLADYDDKCIWLSISSCPLAIWRKSFSSHLCSKYMHQKLFFFPAQNAKFSLPLEGTPHRPSPRSVASLTRNFLFRRHGISMMEIGHFQRRSLANYYERNLKRHAQSSMLLSYPLAIWRKSYSNNLCPKYMHRKLFFGLKMPIPDPELPPLGCFAPSQINFGDMEIL